MKYCPLPKIYFFPRNSHSARWDLTYINGILYMIPKPKYQILEATPFTLIFDWHYHCNQQLYKFFLWLLMHMIWKLWKPLSDRFSTNLPLSTLTSTNYSNLCYVFGRAFLFLIRFGGGGGEGGVSVPAKRIWWQTGGGGGGWEIFDWEAFLFHFNLKIIIAFVGYVFLTFVDWHLWSTYSQPWR